VEFKTHFTSVVSVLQILSPELKNSNDHWARRWILRVGVTHPSEVVAARAVVGIRVLINAFYQLSFVLVISLLKNKQSILQFSQVRLSNIFLRTKTFAK